MSLTGPGPKEATDIYEWTMVATMRASCIYAVLRLGIPDLLVGGKKHYSELAKEAGVQTEWLFRVLRALSSAGTELFDEDGDGRFSLNNHSLLLLKQERSMCWLALACMGKEMMAAGAELPNSLKSGTLPFEAASGKPFFEYLKEHPSLAHEFNMGMYNLPNNHLVHLAEYDFGSFKSIVDVGGSHGVVLASVMKQYPSIKEGYVFDLAHVLVTKQPLLPNITLHPGSFFELETYPKGHDAYMMKHIIHDWDDASCIKILANCAKSMPKDGRVLVIDSVLPGHGDFSLSEAKWLDMTMMMATSGGKERTLEQFSLLFTAAGLKISKVVRVPNDFTSIIEGVSL